MLNVPSPVTGRLHGIDPTGELIAVFPEQAAPRRSAAVLKLRSALNDAGNVFITYVDTLFGRFAFMNWMNCGVRSVPVREMATSDRSTSPEVKKNVWSLRIGPPNPHAVSLRLKSGMVTPCCFSKLLRVCRSLFV